MPAKVTRTSSRYTTLASEAPAKAAAAVQRSGEQCKTAMIGLCPVGTGHESTGHVHMRDTIEGEIQVASGVASYVIKIGAPYWRFVERGTAHSPAQPFVGPAVDTVREGFLADAADVAKG